MGVIVRRVLDRQDCESVVALTAAAFPEEVRGSGLTRHWTELELEDLVKQSWCWANIGVACAEGEGTILGAIVLAFPDDPDTGITYTDVRHKVGCCGTLRNWAYDQILEEPLKAHECLIEFIAVSPSARGKGVGTNLLAWAENLVSRRALPLEPKGAPSPTDPPAMAMTLWVAADNAPALALYGRHGYATTARTDCGAFAWLHARLLKMFLGHPIWVRMVKQVPLSLMKKEPESAAAPSLLRATREWSTVHEEAPSEPGASGAVLPPGDHEEAAVDVESR